MRHRRSEQERLTAQRMPVSTRPTNHGVVDGHRDGSQTEASTTASEFGESKRGARIRPAAVVVGCSTGGPAGLTRILESITVPLAVPILVVQHMPPRFTKRFADNLNNRVETRVVEARHGMIAEAGTCYIAPGGLHMEISRDSEEDEIGLSITDSIAVSFCKPSVDKLFVSAANVLEHRTVAVMLTGMGRDGSLGASRLAELGCPVVAQDEESSTVWGMPKAVVESGAATDVLHLDQIGPRIQTVAMIGYHRKLRKGR